MQNLPSYEGRAGEGVSLSSRGDPLRAQFRTPAPHHEQGKLERKQK